VSRPLAEGLRSMKLLSVNIGKPRGVPCQGKLVRTGIYKEPVSGAVMANELGLEGDGQADLSVHGGKDKAVYAYPHEHYAYWADELGRDDFVFGQFGENLTVEGLLESDLAVGDRLRIGDALLEVSQPRSPCLKLGIRMRQADFPKRFVASGKSGFYLRVIESGSLSAGDPIEHLQGGQGLPTLSELLDAYYHVGDHVELVKRAIDTPALSQAWRDDFTKHLQRLAEARD